MKLLHISDLHLTDPFEHFEEVWLPVAGCVKQDRFDAVIVSGDLTQAAAPNQYEQLERFLVNELLPLVHGRRERIVLVPGNHDVEWQARVATPVSLASLEPSAVAAVVKQALRSPERGRHRANIGPLGHLDILELDPARYPTRFNEVQQFLSRFYGQPPEGNRVFNLTGPDNDHWSAHLFPDARTAIYGFNTAARNDRFWTGATLDARAIAEAQRHAERHAAGFLRLAVWHHGLTTDKGRPDALSLVELSRLYHAGFRVGFHGHTHSDEARLIEDFLGDRFAIVATGSLGAGSAERPDAVGNQFSIVRVHPGQVHVQVFERKGVQFVPQPTIRLDVPRPRPPPPTAHADLHQRSWRVDTSTGIVSCTVTLDRLDARSPVILAMPSEPHGHARGEAFAHTPRGPLEVLGQSLASGAQRFELTTPGTVEHCTWSYHVSNSVSLTRWEHVFRAQPVQHLNLPDEDELSHLVRFPCERLQLEVEFTGPDAAAVVGGARALVSRRVERRGESTWELEPDEQARCRVESGATRLALEVHAPLVGCRYAIAFRLAARGHVANDGLLPAITDVLKTCRAHRDADRVRSGLVECVRAEAGLQLDHESSWLCLLLSEERKRVLPAFGEFPEPSWNVRFPIGEGVAGHAFRFGKPAFWHEGAPGESSLIYRERTEVGGPFLRHYEWIACFPILALEGCPVGVFSFAGGAPQKPTEALLDRLAREICRGGTGMEAEVQRLWDSLNRGFWAAVARDEAFNDRTRKQAETVLLNRAGRHAPQP